MADVNLSIELVSSASEQLTHRVRKFGFGDGYEQIAQDGINSRSASYDITTRPLNLLDADTVSDALDKAATGDYLLMTLKPFSYVQRRYRLVDSSYTRQFLKAPNDNSFITTSGRAYVMFQFTLVEAFSS